MLPFYARLDVIALKLHLQKATFLRIFSEKVGRRAGLFHTVCGDRSGGPRDLHFKSIPDYSEIAKKKKTIKHNSANTCKFFIDMCVCGGGVQKN